jgi:hypothetical protein
VAKVTVRTFEDGDFGEAVAALRPILYPDLVEAYDAGWYASVWRWLETHALANELHRWVLLGEGQQVVGFLGAMPQSYRIHGRRLIAHTPTGYMVHPQHGFHALSLMRAFFRACDNCVTCDQNQGVIQIEARFGVEEVARLRYAAKLLDAAKLPGPVPPPARGLLSRGFQAADGALGAALGSGPGVETLQGFDGAFDRLFEDMVSAVPCLPEKDAAFLRWRYGPGSPQAPVTILGAKAGERLLGYAVLRVSSKGRDGYLLDLAALPGRPDASRVLLREAVRHFRQQGAYIIRYRFLESPVSPRAGDLRRLGFFFKRGGRPTLLVKLADPGLQATAHDGANWAYSIGDGELSFWYP